MYEVIVGGCNSNHPATFYKDWPVGLDCYIILLIKSPTHFQIKEKTYIIRNNSILLISPHTPYKYWPLSDKFINDYVRFVCTDQHFAEKYATLLNRPIEIHTLAYYNQYIQHILWEFHYALPEYKQDNVSALFRVLFNKLLQELQLSASKNHLAIYAAKLQQLRMQMSSQPYKKFTAAELANSINISVSYFQSIYKEYFGISFKTDLTDMRLIYAQSLIAGTGMTFEQIAQACGYSNPSFFYKLFKAKMGMTPRQYRDSLQPIITPPVP